ncbi:MAG TPA: hypothetical protein VD837_09215 [Terriglobales bacterium]|nr:hypothetical protein [Terriglobales bacterium]
MKKAASVLLAVVVLGVAQVAMAQNPAVNTTTIRAVKAESLSISAAVVPDFAINAGGAESTQAENLAITTIWNLTPSRSKVDVCAGASNLVPASALTNPDTISASAVQISKDSGSSWATLNAGAGCNTSNVTVVNTYNLTAQTDRKSQTKVDTVQLKLAGLPANLQADEYTGTVTVYAYVQ